MSEETKIPPIWQAVTSHGDQAVAVVANGNDYATVAATARSLGFSPPCMRRNPAILKHWPWSPMTEAPPADADLWVTILRKWNDDRDIAEAYVASNGSIKLINESADADAFKLLAWRLREIPTPFEGRWDE